MKLIRCTQTVSQILEEAILNGYTPEPISKEVIETAKRKAKYFLRYGKYPN